MQTFHDHHGIVFELEFVTPELAFAGLKVEARQFNLFTVQKISYLLAEEWQVECLNVLEIPITVVVERSVFAVDEVVIHGEHNGANTVDEHLDGQTFAERCFT